MDEESTIVLGRGGFGSVFLSTWNNQPVAIKVPYDDPRALKSFKREIDIHHKLHHPHIVSFIIAFVDESTPELIMELMLDGDLAHMLSSYQGDVPEELQFSIAMDIAQGLNYLHAINIIHRDLKSTNIMLKRHNETFIAKIADFGLAASLLDNEAFSEYVGTPYIKAPELYTSYPPYPYSTKSDIYAFAGILWTLASKKTPFKRAQSHQDLYQIIANGVREEIPANTHRDLARLISRSWKQHPDQRPSALGIINLLKKRLKQPTVINTTVPFQLSPYQLLALAASSGESDACLNILQININPALKIYNGKTAEDIWHSNYSAPNPFTLLREELLCLATGQQNLSRNRQRELRDLIFIENTNLLHWELEKKHDGRNFLMLAFVYRNNDMIQRLTTHRQWPEFARTRTSNGYTLLHHLAANNAVSLYNYLAFTNIDINDVNHTNKASALFVAAKEGNIEFCQLLINQGADLDLQSTTGYTALAIAARYGHANICQLLLRHHANPWLENHRGETAEKIWCKHQPQQHNPFNVYCRNQNLEHKKSQIMALFIPEKLTILPALYRQDETEKARLDELKQVICQANFNESDSADTTADDVLNKAINTWETTLPPIIPGKKNLFFSHQSNQGVLIKKRLQEARAFILIEKINDETSPRTSFLPKVFQR